MRTYRLPQGLDVAIRGDRRLLNQVARYLDAHAQRRPDDAPGDWTIRLARPPVARFSADADWQAFGEIFRLAWAEDGALRLSHPGAPDQIWRPSSRTVDIVAPPGSRGDGVVQSVYAAARQIGLIAASQAGMAVIHAAAVGAGPGTVLLCGPKGAGKTTLSLALMSRGAVYMASDRTIAWQTGDGARTCGWTGSFRIAPAALELVLDGRQAEALARYMRRRRAARAYWFGGKFRFPPQDLIRLCGWPSQQGTAPRLLVELDPARPSAGVAVPLSRAELQAAWRRHLVPGALPPPLEPGDATPMEVPPSLEGIRLQGRTAPQIMADRILGIIGETAP